VKLKVSRRWLIYLAAAGPGLIAAAAGNDAGGIVTYSSAGAQFIYRTLFLMVLITVAYVIVQEMVARLATYTGKGLAALIREEFDLRLTAFAITAFAVANIGLMVTEFGGIATSFELFNVSRYISIPIAAVAIWSLVLFGSYRYAERIFLLLTLVFIAYPVAAVLAHPNWHQVAVNTVWPHFEASKSFLLLSVALIGTTITPYIQLYEAGAVVDKGVKPENYHFQRVDAITGAVLAAHAATAILAQRQEEQLQAALLTRDRIGQAKGIIMVTYGVGDVVAFEMLRRISQETQTKLADIAQRVIDTRGEGK